MLQDGIAFNHVETTDSSTTVYHRPSTPAQALRLLPANATPSQQDSIVQVYCKPVILCHSSRPDTLSLPSGLRAKATDENISLNKIKDGFFTNNQFLKSKTYTTIPGIPGKLIPYQVSQDPFITITLLISLIFVLLVAGRNFNVIKLQLKNIFHNRSRNETVVLLREGEMRSLPIILIILSFLFSTLALQLIGIENSPISYATEPYELLYSFTLVSIGYFLLKTISYAIVNWTFFEHSKIVQFFNIYKILHYLFGVSLLLVTFTIVYFKTSQIVNIVICASTFCLYLLAILFKANQIFFNYKFGYLHLFLYFCTLEISNALILYFIFIKLTAFTLI